MEKKKKVVVPYTSLLRKFNVYFVFTSLLPFLLLFYLYLQKISSGKIEIEETHFFLILFAIGVLSLFFFFIIRSTVFKLVQFTQKIKSSFGEKIDKELIMNLSKGKGEIAELARVFGDIFSRLEENIKELEKTKRKLYNVITRVGKTLTSIEDFDALIKLILETAVGALEVKKGAIFSWEDSHFNVRATVGWEGISSGKILQVLEPSLIWIEKERRLLLIPSLEKRKGDIISPPLIFYPLISRERFWGGMVLCERKEGRNFTEDELKIISNLSSQIAVAFENFKLSRDIERTYFETISALALAVEAKDSYSRGHSERVGRYAEKIAKRLNLSQEETEALRDAARLHDIGKIGIEDKLLKKEGKLSLDEREIICKHPIIGENILKPLKSFSRLLEPIRHHHELLDGSGYPDGLKGDQIPLITRVLTVADIFDALTTKRPYREALSYEEAKKELRKLVDEGKIDKKVVDTLFAMIDKKEL